MLIDKLIFFLLFLISFLVPLSFDPRCFDSFELPKVTLLRILTIMIIVILFFKKGKKFENNVLVIPMLLFSLVLIISTVTSINIIQSIKGTYKREEGLLTYLNYIFLFFIASTISNKKYVEYLIIVAILAGVITSIYANFQHFGIDIISTQAGIERSYSTLNHPNFLAGYLVLVLPLCFIKIFFDKNNILKILYLISFLIMVLALLFTYCRGAWLAFVASLSIVILFICLSLKKIFSKYDKPRNIILLSISGVLFIILILIANHPTINKSSFNLVQRAKSIVDMQNASIAARLTTWRSCLHIIARRPSLESKIPKQQRTKKLIILNKNSILGTGLDTFKMMFPLYKYEDYVKFEGLHITADKTHCETLHLTATLGFLGIFSYFFVLLTFFIKMLHKIKRAGEVKYLLVGILSSFIAYLVQAQFSFSVIALGVLFYLLLGLGVGLDEKIAPEINLHKGTTDKKKKKGATGKAEKKRKIEKRKIENIEFTPTNLLIAVASIPFIIISVYPWVADYNFLKGYLHYNAKIYDKAINYYEQAIRLVPYEEYYYVRLAEAYEEEGYKLDDINLLNRAIKTYKKAIKLDILNAYNYSKLCKVYAYLGKSRDKKYMDEALKVIKKAHSLDPTNPVFFNNLGAVYNDLKKPDKAIPYLKKAISLSPNYLLANSNMGISLVLKEKYKEAIPYFERASGLDKTHIPSLNGLGFCYYKIGEIDKAKEYFNKVLEIEPENETAKQFLSGLEKIK